MKEAEEWNNNKYISCRYFLKTHNEHCEEKREIRSTSPLLSTPLFNSCRFSLTPLPHIFHFYPPPHYPHPSHISLHASFSPIYPSPPLLLTPSLVRFLIRAGRTMVPLLPLFRNTGLKQMLFTKAAPHPRPSPSLQPSPSLI